MTCSTELSHKQCKPCQSGEEPLRGNALKAIASRTPDWQIVNETYIQRGFTFPDFRSALEFVNRVGELAEEQGHHPDLFLAWGEVDVKLWTHKIDGLSENDFIMASKINDLYPSDS